MSHDDSEANGKRPGFLSTAYSRRLFGLLFVALAVAFGVRAALKPATYGQYGSYRGAAIEDERSRTPALQGKATCAKCHASEFDKHDKDVHLNVECESCHGPGKAHVQAREAKAPATQGKLFTELGPDQCLRCHRKTAARPALHPTIDRTEHYAFRGVNDPATPCQSCHSPHEPLFLERKVTDARMHPLIHPCADCHLDRETLKKPLPAGHVVTFQCQDCHKEIAKDAATKKHTGVDCSTCHIFRKDSDFSGRIFKNGNPRFCLMCHEKKPFKTQGKIPLIEGFKQHVEEMAADESEKTKRCADCHLEEKIHGHQDALRAAALQPPAAVSPTDAKAPETGDDKSDKLAVDPAGTKAGGKAAPTAPATKEATP